MVDSTVANKSLFYPNAKLTSSATLLKLKIISAGNWPFSSSLQPAFQNESECEVSYEHYPSFV